VVVDEAQSISDGARGVLLQWVLDDLLSRNAKAQVLFASPNVRNLNVFAHLFGLEDVKQVSSSETTVAQNFLTVKITSKTKGRVSVIRTSPGTEAEVAQILLFLLDNRENAEAIYFCIGDVQEWLIKKGWRGQDSATIRRLIQVIVCSPW